MQSILVVEDGAGDQVALKEILAKNGYFVHRVRTACEAAVAMDAVDFDLVIVDAGVPDRPDGLSHRARSHGIVALVVAGAPDTIAALADRGAPYLARPYLVDELLDVVRRHIRNRSPIEES
jgi:DNA-binding response OmpR family regulator